MVQRTFLQFIVNSSLIVILGKRTIAAKNKVYFFCDSLPQSCHKSFFLSQIAIYNYIINNICKNMEPKSPIKVSITRLLLSQLSFIIYLGLHVGAHYKSLWAPIHASVRQFCIEKICFVCSSEKIASIFRFVSLGYKLQTFCFVFTLILPSFPFYFA
jgi:hypothetical protein